MDLENASSYQTGAGIYNKIVTNARTLSNFQGKRWAGQSVFPGTDFDTRVLRIVLQDISITKDQMMGLQVAELYISAEYDIQLIITVTQGMH